VARCLPDSRNPAINTDAEPSDGSASRELRDKFLAALDADDYAALRALSVALRNCTDIVPRSVCLSLGLPRGSTYAIAAMTIIA
jgi:hypothetical protein